MDNKIYENLKNLGFSKNEIKVYVALTQLGESPASSIAKKAGIPRTTAISILNKMSDDSFVSIHKYKGTMYYWVESPMHLKEIFETRASVAEELGKSLSDLYRSEANFPFGAVYDTKKSIRGFIEKIIASSKKGTTFYTIDSPAQGNYRKIFPAEYGKTLIELKDRKGIVTKTLVPHGSFKNVNVVKIKNNTFFLREMPQEIEFNASFWVIKDLIVFFSGNPPFVSVVKHSLIVPSMQSIYKYLWSISEEKYPT